MKSEMPFGTFLAAATFLTIIFGSQMTLWYSGLLL
jgi:prepilin signal peptidase PulO-like enzyme (type II secretory pathway)